VVEKTPIDPEVEQSLREHVVPAALAISARNFWLRSQMLHVRVTGDALLAFGDLIIGLPAPQVCIHMYAYAGGAILLKWTPSTTLSLLPAQCRRPRSRSSVTYRE
jgi:hypothetical protein